MGREREGKRRLFGSPGQMSRTLHAALLILYGRCDGHTMYRGLPRSTTNCHFRPTAARCFEPRAATRPFGDLKQSADTDIESMLRADIGRRRSELILLGWLGRAYLLAPLICRFLSPKLFVLSSYEASAVPCYRFKQALEVTLKESSIVGRGIPFRLRFDMDKDPYASPHSVQLLGIGCNLRIGDVACVECSEMTDSEVEALCRQIDENFRLKRLVVEEITACIFSRLGPVGSALSRAMPLEAVGTAREFTPRRELFAREGSSEKWLEQVSGYYFAQSYVQRVRFPALDAPDLVGIEFTCYLDPSEPLNSEDRMLNVNPEVIQCSFL